jgi:GntR family transcriptional repressor for pyruvate dehydrogenase complex
MNGTFSVGEYLPSEQALAEQFEVSRTTMRDAISSLVEKGFLERHHGKGVYVIDKSDSVVSDSLRIFMLRGNYSVSEFMETRSIIESQIANLAAIRAKDDQIEKMRQFVDLMNDSNNTIEKYIEYDLEFHMVLAESSQNHLLIAVFAAMKPLLEQMINQVVISGGQVEQKSKFHFNILEAIVEHNPVAAQSRMQMHLKASEDMFIKSLKKGGLVSDLIN